MYNGKIYCSPFCRKTYQVGACFALESEWEQKGNDDFGQGNIICSKRTQDGKVSTSLILRTQLASIPSSL